MITTIETYVLKSRVKLRKWSSGPKVRRGCKVAAHLLSGFLLSGAGMGPNPIPLTVGLVCATQGWRALVRALGGGAGYALIWGQGGEQGILWMALSAVMVLILGRQRGEETRLLRCALAALTVSASGLIFQLWFQDTTPVPLYALRVALGAMSAAAFQRLPRREGDVARERLERMSGVLSETRLLLMDVPEMPIDQEAILQKARLLACGGCPCRKNCRVRLEPLPRQLLHRPLVDTASLPGGCKKPVRLLLELRRGQEQFRQLRGERDRQREYRAAVCQQYQFLENFLQQAADGLPRRYRRRFEPEVRSATRSAETVNGDRLCAFPGVDRRYYVLLCDGMGTGPEAGQEGQTAAGMLRQMLEAGFPGAYALRSVNSLLILRGRSGAATMDLAEIYLDSGQVMLYKWGAAPSWVLGQGGTEKIGTAGPPPGLSVAQGRETSFRLSLGRGEVLIMASDGVDMEEALRRCAPDSRQPPGELAAQMLERGGISREEDATVAVIRLVPAAAVSSYHLNMENAVETQDVG